MPRSTTRENNGKCLGNQRVHSKFSSVGKLPANVMFTRVHLQHNMVRKPPTTPANNGKPFRKTACSLGVFERKKIAGEYHVFHVLTFDTIRLENLGQTPRWTTEENNRKHFKNNVFTGVFREQENCGLMLCFPCVNRQRIHWENVRKTRHSPDRENERKRCRKQRIHCRFLSAGKHSMNFTFFRRSQKENAEFTGRFSKSRKRMANRKFS